MPGEFQPIRPMLAPAAGGEAFTLDAFLPPLESLRAGDVVAITGGPGSGKTSTLRQLKKSLPEETVLWDNASDAEQLRLNAVRFPVIYTAGAPFKLRHALHLVLQPWTRDQWIEYLLANRREQCASVMRRLAECRNLTRLAGVPRLWSIALGFMALDETLPDPVSALRRRLRHDADQAEPSPLLCHPLCAAINTSDRIVQQVAGGDYNALPVNAGGDLLIELAVAVKRPEFAKALETMLASRSGKADTMPVTLLHLAGIGWRPPDGAALDIPRARLPGVDWSGITLKSLDAAWADMRDSCLAHAYVRKANLQGVNLSGAGLRSARLPAADLVAARLDDADLSDSLLCLARLWRTNLSRANLESADLHKAEAREADFTEARLVRADLIGAKLNRCNFTDADLSAACLRDAHIDDCDLRSARLHGASCAGAAITRCRFDALTIEAPNFQHAIFMDCDFSLSTFRNALFAKAHLNSCGLADIDWEGANLRDASFYHSTFHAGSSRSGLVDSPLASEGTRTGFYTDDYADRTHKAPEEIRKANLCHADLRGADVTGVDFYLVDLRRAKYDQAQAEWFRRCGAILFNKR